MRYPAIVEIKYDGELNLFDHGVLINKYGTTRENFTAIANIPHNCVLLGELFTGQGKAGELYNLLSNKTNDDALTYEPFDILEYNGVDMRKETLSRRRNILDELCPTVTYEWADNKNEVMEIYEEIISLGYEGCVVKSLESQYRDGPCSWVKLKHKDQSDYKVTLVEPLLERIEVDVAGVIVGCKCPNKYKKSVKVGDLVTIEHQGVLASGSLRHPVFIRKAAA